MEDNSPYGSPTTSGLGDGLVFNVPSAHNLLPNMVTKVEDIIKS